MNSDRQYLFPSGASHFLGCLLAAGMLGMTIYDMFSGQCVSLREGNVSMDAIMVFLLLAYTSMLEACMMITTKGYLFAYNVDKAICVPIKDHGLMLSVSIGRRLYGPIFDKDCANQFSANPKSTTTRNVFYGLVVLLYFMTLLSPCRYLYYAVQTSSWTMGQIVPWLFLFADGMLIVNRIFFRASIRKVWAYTLGDANFRSVLKFESSTGEDHPPLLVGFNVDKLPDYNKRGTSRTRLISTGVILVALIVWGVFCFGR